MKGQLHNQGELAELNVKIEKEIVASIKKMSENTKLPIDEIVVIALKRFRSSHSDWEGTNPRID